MDCGRKEKKRKENTNSQTTKTTTMLRLKKKAEAKVEEEKIAESKSSENISVKSDVTPMETDEPTTTHVADEKSDEGKVSLLGVGGKSTRTDGSKKAGKKRTPGEIRIQKGLE